MGKTQEDSYDLDTERLAVVIHKGYYYKPDVSHGSRVGRWSPGLCQWDVLLKIGGDIGVLEITSGWCVAHGFTAATTVMHNAG